jgi:hypothetical protein
LSKSEDSLEKLKKILIFRDLLESNLLKIAKEREKENPTNKTPQEALLSEIYQERYIYLLGNYEAFTDFRRTSNIAGITLKPFAGTPQRLIYAQTEVNSNPNVPSPLPKATDKTEVNN